MKFEIRQGVAQWSNYGPGLGMAHEVVKSTSLRAGVVRVVKVKSQGIRALITEVEKLTVCSTVVKI